MLLLVCVLFVNRQLEPSTAARPVEINTLPDMPLVLLQLMVMLPTGLLVRQGRQSEPVDPHAVSVDGQCAKA